jgi:hypothetical protein
MVRRHPSQIRFSQDFRLQVTFASGEPTGAGGAIRFLQKLRTNALRPQKD